ncbi:hypothetical protein [Leeuwenhoekiella parthenopeia]|uniref:Uncharacterized protein n=1 Tax=Leeuwenhoekiella parthenopeia TaxID=2890320 RepID=A0ABS8GRQ2_9FLAO|nr:hypothetical protein [Leeuwenhoekiella parthenopeia]MCC4212652.1 hypothetical protein [Leeuwenhoekiella parthenopeia]
MKTRLLLFAFLISMPAFTQVGIGTVTPEADLHVAGDMIIQQEVEFGILPSVNNTDEDFKLLTRQTNSTPINGEITRLDVDELTVAPINVFKYYFGNINYDNITDLNLGFETSRYIVGIADFRYIGAPVNKVLINNADDSIGAFVVRTFQSGGTWHLEIRNRFLNTTGSTNQVNYEVTFIIYDTSFYRQLPTITTNLGGSNVGTASTIPDLY